AYVVATNDVSYEKNNIAKQFALIARLIKGNLGTKIFMVTLDGFDTHADQPNRHKKLMGNFTRAISNFYADLAVQNRDSDVLTMTISEFGRRSKENASNGTDHGAASTMLLFGEGLNGNGFVGNHPDLSNLDSNGNMDFTTDFRDVYATILEKWLCIDSSIVDNVLLNNYNRADLGLRCSSVIDDDSDIADGSFKHYPVYGNETVYVEFVLSRAMEVEVQLVNILGQNIGIIHKERYLQGTHRVNLNPQARRYTPGHYIYRIFVEGKSYSKSIILAK
ncbi:Protein of unknown function (DUF1501), partial [hydrothermal vent metagenome]